MVRDGCTEDNWKETREDFVGKAAEGWELRGLVFKKRQIWEERKKKEEEEKGGAKDKYVLHLADRIWTDVGYRYKLVVDSEATAKLLNRRAVIQGSRFEPIVHRCLNIQ